MKDWAGVGEAYSASYAALCAGTFPVMCDASTGALGSVRGRSLVDVGSGDGTLAAAWRDDGWRVTACEPEETMRAVSRRRHPHIEVVGGGLPRLPFADGAFDAAVANFVLNHVASPRAAARELGRISRELVIATTWVRSPSWLWAGVAERAGLAPFAGERLPPEEDFDRTAEGFGRMLGGAGLDRAAVTEHTWSWEAAPDALWISVEGGVAGAGAQYASLDAEDRDRFRAAFDDIVAERSVGGRLRLDHTAAIAVCPLG